jgi:hypothetical protein
LSMKAFGISLLGPRILVLAGAAGVAVCIFALARHYEVNWQIASSFAILFLCLPLVWLWIPVLRVDFWGVVFSLLGILTFATRPNRWAIAAALFALAALTKPTAAAALAACLIELLLQKRFATAAKIALLFGLLTSFGMFSFGGYPLFHLLKTHPDEFSLVHALSLYLLVLGLAIPVVIIIGLALRFRFRWRPDSQLLWIYLGMCCLTAFSAGKLGSDSNHFLELQAALCIIAAVASQYLFDYRNRIAISILTLAVITLLGLTLQARVLPLTRPAILGPEAIQVEQCGAVYSFIQSFRGHHVLSNDVSALVLAGKPVEVSNPFVTTQLGDSISWSNGRLDYLAAHRYFDLIVLGQSDITGRWSPEFVEALMRNYKPIREFQCNTAGRAFVPQ